MACIEDIKIYTSYFGNVKKILKAFPNACLVSIAGKTPDGFSGVKYTKLAPHYSWWNIWHKMFEKNLNSMESKEWYVDKYYETVLDKLNAHDVVAELCSLAGDSSTIFLLCYETPNKFCHRHTVEFWFNIHRIECEEWTNEN